MKALLNDDRASSEGNRRRRDPLGKFYHVYHQAETG